MMKNFGWTSWLNRVRIDPSTISLFTVILFFITYLLVGMSISSDYGISIDESYEMQTAQITINYIQGTSDALLTYDDRHYGALLSIPLEFIGLKYQDSQQIFFVRHLMNFLLFYGSALLFYFLLRKFNFSRWISLLGVAILVLHPHLFSNSFYNIKDIPFLGMYILGNFTLVLLIEKPTITSTILHGLITGMMIVFRITGSIMVVTTVIMISVLIFNHPYTWKKLSGFSFLYLLTAGVTVISLLPALWHDPIHELLVMFSMKNLVWPYSELFLGGSITADTIPWNYHPIYFLVTTPIIYFPLFLVGSIFLVERVIGQYRATHVIDANKMIQFASFYVPMILLLVVRPVVYNGWRHIFFIFVGFVLVSMAGLTEMFENNLEGRSWFKNFRRVGIAAIVIQFFVLIQFLFSSHPYQFTYYNVLAGPSLGQARERYLMDYWGLSYREALEALLILDTSSTIKVTARLPYYLSENRKVLDPTERQRIIVVETESEADYLLTTFMDSRAIDIPGYDLVSAIYVDDAIINGTYRSKSK